MLEAENINTFYGLSHILFDISFSIEKGEVVCLLGRNGAGKSTTIRSVMGLTPPRSGSITFKGENITKWAPFKIARFGIGFVDENRRIFPDLTVIENLEIAAKNSSADKVWTVDDVYELFPALKKLHTRRGGYLSGGEQQMLAVARTLMGNPEFLLLDEPSSGLSPLVVGELENQIQKLKEEGITMLLSEQNVNFALYLSDRCYVLDKGAICFQGTIEQLEENEQVMRQYLAV